MKRFKFIIAIIALFAFISMDSFAIEPKTSFTTVKVKIDQNGFNSWLDITHVTITVSPFFGVPIIQTKPYNGEQIMAFQVSVTNLGNTGTITPSLSYTSSNPFIQLHVYPYTGSWNAGSTQGCKVVFGP